MCPIHLVLPQSHLHRSQLVQCAAWAHPACGFATRPLAKRVVGCVLMQEVSPTAAQLCDVAISKFEEYCRVNSHGPKESVNHGRDDIENAVLGSWPRLAVQCLCSNVYIAYLFQSRPWIVWPVWWPWIRWTVIRRWRQTLAQFATRQSSRRRAQSPVQYATRQNFRRHLRGMWTRQSALVRIEWRICRRRGRSPSLAETILYEDDLHPVRARRSQHVRRRRLSED